MDENDYNEILFGIGMFIMLGFCMIVTSILSLAQKGVLTWGIVTVAVGFMLYASSTYRFHHQRKGNAIRKNS